MTIERLAVRPAVCTEAMQTGHSEEPAPVPSTELRPSGAGEGCEVLLLDDDEINNVLMAQAIRGIAGCRPLSFNDPGDALAAISAEPDRFSTVVTDYDMPGMNGIAFVRHVRAIEGMQHVPVIMVTSFDQRRIRRDALEAGVTDFMGKPFDASEVKARLTNLLALDAARRRERDRSAWLAREVALATQTIREREREIVIRLARAAEYRDTDTGDHVARVALLARSIAVGLGCDPAWCDDLELASTMHDVGKIAVPDSLLLKPGRLSPEERAIIRRHTDFGYGILENSASAVIALAAEIALTHHERWDGQGYPRGLGGTDIPLSGRIVAVADVFDALVSDRPYKRAWSVEDTLDYIRTNAGSQFDPTCVAAFLDRKAWLEAEQPIGFVELER